MNNKCQLGVPSQISWCRAINLNHSHYHITTLIIWLTWVANTLVIIHYGPLTSLSHHETQLPMIQVMAYHLHDTKPLPEPILPYHELNMYDEKYSTGLILGLRPANERRCYFVTPSLIGWAQTYNQPRSTTTMKHPTFQSRQSFWKSPLEWCLGANELSMSYKAGGPDFVHNVKPSPFWRYDVISH